MKKILLLLFLIVSTLSSFAQEPGNNLGKSICQIRQQFPDAVNSGPSNGGGDLWISFDEDEFHEYAYYFDIRDGRVFSESMMVDSAGFLKNAGYFFFITTVQIFYNRGGWRQCDVDNSILRAASVLRSEHRLVWADTFEANLEYSNFLVFFQYNQKEGYTMMTYYPR